MKIRIHAAATATLVGLAVLVLGATGAQAQPNTCHAGKIKCVSKKKSCKLGVESKARKKGLPPDTAKLQKCEDKFDGGADPTKGCFAKLEAKNDGPCPTFGDTAALEAKVDAFVADVVGELDLNPADDLNKCTAGKIKCVRKKDKCILGVHTKAEKTGLPPDTAKLAKCKEKFDGGAEPTKGCFEKLENKIPNDCLTFDDTAALEAKIDAFDADVLNELSGGGGGGTCPTVVTFESGTSSDRVADLGWTGLGHDNPLISEAMLAFAVTSCPGTEPPCGNCTLSGPILNPAADAGNIHDHRCTGNTRTKCTTDADCAVPGGTCEFYFGSFLHQAVGGVSFCSSDRFSAAASGSYNPTTGEMSVNGSLLKTIYSGITIDQPCPTCIGDGPVNDGVRGGTCDNGQNPGLTCDISGVSPNPTFGNTSLDCPPLSGATLGTVAYSTTFGTNGSTRTLSAASPTCRNFAFTTLKCLCDTCNNDNQEPCSSNADCPDPAGPSGPICGGRRCLGGTNDGAPCAVNSECPGGGVCGIPGEPTRPNTCDDMNGMLDDDCGPAGSDTDGGPNEAECVDGPVIQHCAPNAPHRECFNNSDCSGGDTCSTFDERECYPDNGVVGGSVTASGIADPPSGHMADPTLGALYCVGPASAPAANITLGLPGLIRLELPVHVTDDGTP